MLRKTTSPWGRGPKQLIHPIHMPPRACRRGTARRCGFFKGKKTFFFFFREKRELTTMRFGITESLWQEREVHGLPTNNLSWWPWSMKHSVVQFTQIITLVLHLGYQRTKRCGFVAEWTALWKLTFLPEWTSQQPFNPNRSWRRPLCSSAS